jgi:hypothetical protein
MAFLGIVFSCHHRLHSAWNACVLDPALECRASGQVPAEKTGDLLEREAVDPYSRLAGL